MEKGQQQKGKQKPEQDLIRTKTWSKNPKRPRTMWLVRSMEFPWWEPNTSWTVWWMRFAQRCWVRGSDSEQQLGPMRLIHRQHLEPQIMINRMCTTIMKSQSCDVACVWASSSQWKASWPWTRRFTRGGPLADLRFRHLRYQWSNVFLSLFMYETLFFVSLMTGDRMVMGSCWWLRTKDSGQETMTELLDDYDQWSMINYIYIYFILYIYIYTHMYYICNLSNLIHR